MKVPRAYGPRLSGEFKLGDFFRRELFLSSELSAGTN